jgi:hypothetical protein
MIEMISKKIDSIFILYNTQLNKIEILLLFLSNNKMSCTDPVYKINNFTFVNCSVFSKDNKVYEFIRNKIPDWMPDISSPNNHIVIVQDNIGDITSIYDLPCIINIACSTKLYGNCDIFSDYNTINLYSINRIKSMNLNPDIINSFNFKLYLYSNINKSNSNPVLKTKLGKVISHQYEYLINYQFDSKFNLVELNPFSSTTFATGTTPNNFGTTFATTTPTTIPNNFCTFAATTTPNNFGTTFVTPTTTPNNFGTTFVTPTTTPNNFGTFATATPNNFGTTFVTPTTTPNNFGTTFVTPTTTPNNFGTFATSTANNFGTTFVTPTTTPNNFGTTFVTPTTTPNNFGTFATATPNNFGTFAATTTPNNFGTFATATPNNFGTTPNNFGTTFGPATTSNNFGITTMPNNFGTTFGPATTPNNFGNPFGLSTTTPNNIFGSKLYFQ